MAKPKAAREPANNSQLEKQVDSGLNRPGGNKDAFTAMLRRAVPDEADSPESETSEPA